jgi:predicted DNA-binding transcriptional regulator AlpA
MSESRLLSPGDLAEREGVPLKTIYAWNYVGSGPRYLRVGRFVRYRLTDVVAWEDARYADAAGGGSHAT